MLKYKIKILNTIGDGSCLIHAILQAFNKQYNNLENNMQKMKLVKEVRFHLSEILDLPVPEKNNTNVYNLLSRGELLDISEHIEEVDLDYMKEYLNSNNFLEFQYIELLSEIFDINIVFISNKKIYHCGDNELLFRDDRDIVLINYIQDIHFETISIDDKTLIKRNDKIYDDIKKLVYYKS